MPQPHYVFPWAMDMWGEEMRKPGHSKMLSLACGTSEQFEQAETSRLLKPPGTPDLYSTMNYSRNYI